MKNILKILPILLITFILTSCLNNNINVSSLVVNHENISLILDKEITLKVSTIPTDATNKELVFESQDSNIATVSSSGVIKAVSLGETKIIVKVKNNPSVFKEINVTVVNDPWSNELLINKFGFTIPKLSNYSMLEILQDDEMLEFKFAGFSNDHEVLEELFAALKNNGWTEDEQNDHHSAEFTHENYEYIIHIHNESSHGLDIIEITISHGEGEHHH